MSLLLDALNKADQERKRNEPSTGINSHHEPVDAGKGGLGLKSIITVATLIGALLLSVIVWRDKNTVTSAPAIATQQAIASTAPNKLTTPTAHTALNTALNVSTPTAATATNPTTESGENSAIPSTYNEQDIASLYEKKAQADAAAAALHLNNPDTDNTNPSAMTDAVENIATDATETTNSDTETNNGSTNSINQFANLPDLKDLPSEILETIPSLNYTEHNYNNYGGSVKINGDIKHVNDQLAKDIVIDKILEDGIILRINNYAFKMRALNSWVNM